ncbi:MAG: tetratricopeptide repeat protein [Planctomycetes bacterium]|nr:tetratricopeptide repeat protein [Planctomycetota bacterium]
MDTFQTAVGHHQAGRIDQAEFLYREVLRLQPHHADALHLLGVIAHQKGLHSQAVELIRQALALQPETATYHVNLAEAYRLAGNLEQAAAHCRQALRLEPDRVEVYNNLGLVLEKQGQLDDAVVAFEAALTRKPHWALPYYNLGSLLHKRKQLHKASAIFSEGLRLCGTAATAQLHGGLSQVLVELGQRDTALFHCEESLRLQPDHPTALTHLGHVLGVLGRRDEARSALQRALQLAPAQALTHQRLGQLLMEEGKFAEAIAAFSQATRLEPDNATFHSSLANAYYENGRDEDAIARYRLVIQLQPQHAEAHNSLGYILQDQSKVQEALVAFREATRLRPNYADAHLNTGLLLTEMGEKEQAIAAFREALRHEPFHPEALGALAMTLRDQLPPADETAIERLLATGRVPGHRQAVVQFGMAQVMDSRNRFDRAADYARKANDWFAQAYRQRGQAYNPAEHCDYVERIIRAYPPEHFERVRGWGIETELPIFIVGLPRSGTSLAEQILASHPQVHGAGELNLARNAYRAIPGLVGKQAPGVDCIADLSRGVVRKLADDYLSGLRPHDPRALRIVDKMPDNYLMLGLIVTLFPQARIIHMRRDVRDVGLSCWLTHFRHIRWACELEHIGSRIVEYQRLMEHWRRVLPVPLLEIDYEAIVADLEGSARRLVSWCGVEWDPVCLSFHDTKRVVRTASMTQVRKPIYQRSVGRWRHYQQWIGPLIGLAGSDTGGEPGS